MDPSMSPRRRIVLLIDLHPLLINPNPNYIAHILASIHRILTFSPLSASALFAYKLFISSLSPLLSSSRLPNSPPLLSFHRPLQTLASLSQTLTSLDFAGLAGASPPPPPRASLVARSLIQLQQDYSWETDPAASKGIIPQTLTFPTNLVLLFSPVYGDCLDLDGLGNSDAFFGEFRRIFSPVSDKFVSRDIHFSWVAVNFEGERKLGFFERGIRGLGWGFCSSDAIVLGSALVPLGLIFPYLGCKMGFSLDNGLKKGQAELMLRITDVSGKPLECKSCNLEVIELKSTTERQDLWSLYSNDLGADFMKIKINGVWRRDETENLIENSVEVALLRGVSDKHLKEKGCSDKALIVHRVLELLCVEKGEFKVGKPIWQLIMSFLYGRNYWALVSIYVGDGNSFEGILKPLTVNSALLSIIERNTLITCQPRAEGSFETHANLLKTKDGRRKRDKMHKKLLEDVTWSSFCEAAFTRDGDYAPEMDLEEIYFAAETRKSKKLRFLECWMKQMKKSSECCQIKPNKLEEPSNVNVEVNERPEGSRQELVLHACVSSAEEAHTSVPINQEGSSFSCLGDNEAYLRTIPQKIEQGICSKEVDLWNLAERLVGLSIGALSAKFRSNASDDSVGCEAEDASELNVHSEVSRFLLVKPKDLMLKYKISSSAPLATDQCSVNYSTENIIREHELQILFRLELLQSEITPRLGESEKQKMVKEICSLLQNIEFYLQGDFLCGESLLEFAGRSIKARYAHSLGEVIHKIYEQMEFFSYDNDEMEASDSLLGSNSEEPNRDDKENDNALKDEAVEVTARAYMQENDAKVHQQFVADNLHDEKVMKAQKQRDRARRLSSFTSWVPDLHRVWALKQPRIEKPALMLKSFPKSKHTRMKRQRNKNEVVCETPMTAVGKKQSHMQQDGSRSCRLPLSKALFQYEGDDSSDMYL